MYEVPQQLIQQEDIKDSPFKLQEDRTKEKPQHYITMGDYRVTNAYPTKEEALEQMNTWAFMTNVIGAMITFYQTHQKLN